MSPLDDLELDDLNRDLQRINASLRSAAASFNRARLVRDLFVVLVAINLGALIGLVAALVRP